MTKCQHVMPDSLPCGEPSGETHKNTPNLCPFHRRIANRKDTK